MTHKHDAEPTRQEREEAYAIIQNLMEACEELMTEYVSKRRAANWGLINEAMVAGAKALKR